MKKSIRIYLDDELHEKLRKISEKEVRTISGHAFFVLRDYIEKYDLQNKTNDIAILSEFEDPIF